MRAALYRTYLSINLVQSVLYGSVHVLLPVREGEGDAVSSWDDGHHLAVGTLTHKGIQRNHLGRKTQIRFESVHPQITEPRGYYEVSL